MIFFCFLPNLFHRALGSNSLGFLAVITYYLWHFSLNTQIIQHLS